MALRLPAPTENPVLTKELRTRLRGARAFWLLFAYAGTLALILFVVYLFWWRQQQQYGGGYGYGYGYGAASTVGRTFYTTLFTVQAVLVGLVTPSLTAGAVSVEKEQRTFDMLAVSLLPRRALVNGKLLAAVAFVALLLTSSLPLAALCFLLGGVSPGEVAAAYVLLLACAALYGAVGVAASATAKSTSAATLHAFGTVLLLFLLTLPLGASATAGYAMTGGGGRVVTALSALNPVGAVAAGALRESYFGATFPAWAAGVALNGLLAWILTRTAADALLPPPTRGGARSVRGTRLLVALFSLLLAFGLYAALLPGAGPASGSPRLYTLGYLGWAAILAPPVWAAAFATGDGLPADVGFARAFFDPRRLGRAEVPSGLAFALLLALGCGGLLVTLTAFGPHAATQRGPAFDLALLMLSSTLLLGAVGAWISAATGVRQAARALVVATACGLSSGPSLLWSGPLRGAVSPPPALNNLRYLTPSSAAAELESPGDAARLRRAATLNGTRPLLFGDAPFARVSAGLYGAAGLALLASTGAAGRFRRRVAALSTAPAPPAATPPSP